MIAREPGNFEIVISMVLEEEIDATPEIETIKKIHTRLKNFPTIRIKESEEAENLAWIYVIQGVLTDTHLDDLRHVAYSVISGCDYLVSWNMRHLSNFRTIDRVNNYNRNNNYPTIIITPPTLFLGENND
ncbi:hypothetical protein FACS189443_4770 [Planctomycetales bacterium]|nr:hypothetical protein FACS189443_4770 [Planctomycetales bacterium]